MSKLTIRIEAPTITIEIDDIEALPQMLLDRLSGLADTKISAATDLPSLARELHQKAAEMRRPGSTASSALAPTPASTPIAEDLPHIDVVSLMLKTRSNLDVVQNLVIPLLRKKLKVKGDPKKVLSDAVNVGRPWSADMQSRVCALLLSGRHVNFPDTGEIYRAHDRVKAGDAPVSSRETVSEVTPAQEEAA